ncbi:hypothetical protein L1049_015549 [Liquidambar formosana]|uniref:NB-ARC domain-containing protein n=1 Tax=Liquidambar formosana TaxID=63359 RepID=A0AAP0X676_LIQFO
MKLHQSWGRFVGLVWENCQKRIVGPYSRIEHLQVAGPEMTSDLVKIGREIVKKCAGVPLAAKNGRLVLTETADVVASWC